MKKCKIVGPYLPVGDTDWMCRTHNVVAHLRNPELGLPVVVRREDVFCPIGINETNEDNMITSLLENYNIDDEIIIDGQRVFKLTNRVTGSKELGIFDPDDPTNVRVEVPGDINGQLQQVKRRFDELTTLNAAKMAFEEAEKNKLTRERQEAWVKVLLEVTEGTGPEDETFVNGTQIDDLARRLAIMKYVPSKDSE